MTKQNWIVAVAWMPLHSQSWQQLQASVVHDRERREEAWRFMQLRSREARRVMGEERQRGS